MRFQVDRKQLSSALSVAASVAKTKTTLPILANVLIRVTDAETLLLASCDTSLTIMATLKCSGGKVGEVALAASRLAEIVGQMRGEEVSFDSKDTSAEVKCGKSKFTLPGLPTGDFPHLPSAPASSEPVDSATLLDLIAKTSHAVSLDSTTRQNLHGMNLKGTGDRLRGESADGHRAVSIERKGGSLKSDGLLIHQSALGHLAKILKGTATAEIGSDATRIYLRAGNTLACLSKLDQVFPPLDGVFPKETVRNAVVPRVELLELVTRVGLVAAAGHMDGMDLFFTTNALKCVAESAEAGIGEESMPINYDGKDFVVCVSARYLREALTSMDGDEVRVGKNTSEPEPLMLWSMDKTHAIAVLPRSRE